MSFNPDFDFDLMKALAENSPREFERRRQELIGAALATCANRAWGEAAQEEIDRVKAQTADGQAAHLRIMASGLNALAGRAAERWLAIANESAAAGRGLGAED